MNLDNYCQKCILPANYPGVKMDESGICSMCTYTEIENSYKKTEQFARDYQEFEENIKTSKIKSDYDCLIMLSGGKDSVYLMHKLKNHDKRNPLAFTVDLPFESDIAKQNIKEAIKIVNIEHVFYTPDLQGYYKLLKFAFTKKWDASNPVVKEYEHYIPKTPCSLCGLFIIIQTYIFATKMNIPYLLYGADPFQLTTLDTDIHRIIQISRSLCGDELFYEIYGNSLDFLQNKNEKELPKILFPYAKINYKLDKIMEEIKRLGLYICDGPQETHCYLWGLLNYYAFKKYSSPFYIHNFAVDVRNKKANREVMIQGIEQFKNLFLKVVESGSPDSTLKEQLKAILNNIYANKSESEWVYNNILDIHKIAKQIDFSLSEI